MRLTETATGLVLSYTPIFGLVCLVFGVLLTGYALRSLAALNGKTFGILMATVMLLYAGIYFLTAKVTLTPESGRRYGFLREDQRVEWAHVADVQMVERRASRGTTIVIIARTGTGDLLEINVADLWPEERQRLLDYIARQRAARR